MKDVRTISLPDAAATKALGRLLGDRLPAGSTLLLEGNLGAGKTTLVQGIAEGLGIKDPVTSPTFVLIEEYLEGRIPLYHMDLYRLSPSEVEGLNLELYWEALEVEKGIVAIEWADRLPYLPDSYGKVCLRLMEGGDRREATLSAVGAFQWEAVFGAEGWHEV